MGVVTGQASWCHRCSSFFVVETREKILCAAIFSLSQEVPVGEMFCVRPIRVEWTSPSRRNYSEKSTVRVDPGREKAKLQVEDRRNYYMV